VTALLGPNVGPRVGPSVGPSVCSNAASRVGPSASHSVAPRVGAASRAAPASPACEADLQLAACVRARAPLRRVLARIAGRLLATHAWEPLSFARLSDWARERAGLSARSVYDLAHVDAALARLPHVEAAFMAGEISWSKTRLLCRVAEPADESRWVAFARRSPVQTLEREVRGVDRGSLEAGAHAEETDEDGALVWPPKTVQVRCTPRCRGNGIRRGSSHDAKPASCSRPGPAWRPWWPRCSRPCRLQRM